MASYTDSSAYDFSLFEEPVRQNGRSGSEKSRTYTKKTPPVKRYESNRAKKRTSTNKTGNVAREDGNAVRKPSPEPLKRSTVISGIDNYQHTVERNCTSVEISPAVKKIFSYGLLCLGLLFCLLCVDAQCDKVTSEISEVKSKIEIADGEAVRLNAELSSKISTDRVESYAENVLGMVKAESYQITYLDLSDGDKVVVSGDKSPNEKSGISAKAKELFAYIF